MPEVPVDRHRLPNGLRVTLARDQRAPIVAVNLWYAVGSANEQAGRTGFAHLFEHLMFQGSTNVAKGEHFSLIEAAGGKANASTSIDRTSYYERLPSHQLALALWLEADRLGGLLPTMTQEKLDNQREVVKNERRREVDNQPYGTWVEALQALLFPEGHPYRHSIFGSMEDLNRASLADVSDFFAAHYAPNKAVLTIAGEFDPPAALSLVEDYFGPLVPNAVAAPAPPTLPQTIGTEARQTIVERVPLPRLYAAFRAPAFGSAGFDALEVAMDLLGAGRASRLQRALVRERQVAQEVSTYAFPEIGGAAVFVVEATARAGTEAEVLESAMWSEFDRLAAEGPSDEELTRVRNLRAAAIESDLERAAERAHRLSMYAALFDEPERINAEVERYAAVDAARAREAVALGLRAENRALLTYLPEDPP